MAHGRPMNRLFANATECDQTLWTRDFSCAHKPDRWPSIQAAEAVALTWAAELHKESDFAQPIHPKVRAKRSYAMLCMLQSSRRCQNSHAHFAFLCIVCPSDPPSVYCICKNDSTNAHMCRCSTSGSSPQRLCVKLLGRVLGL